jgi:hypothetical protein
MEPIRVRRAATFSEPISKVAKAVEPFGSRAFQQAEFVQRQQTVVERRGDLAQGGIGGTKVGQILFTTVAKD